MCTRGQLKRNRTPQNRRVADQSLYSGRTINPLRRMFRRKRYADKKNLSVFKRFGKKDISEMPMSAAARRADRMQQTANNQRRSLLLGGE